MPITSIISQRRFLFQLRSANSQGVATTFTRSDHTHQGLHSINANGGSQRYGDQTLQQGSGISIVDNGSGTFTFSSTSGDTELLVSIGTGLSANYTGGRININGTITNISAGSIALTASTSNGTIYATTAGVTQSSSSVCGANVVPMATYITGASSITSITDSRVFLNDNVVFAVPVTQTPDQSNSIGTTNNHAMADHVHNIATAVPVSIGSANALGVSTSFVRSDHVHQGVHSYNVNKGSPRYGDVTLQQGANVTLTDNGSGTVTIATSTNNPLAIIQLRNTSYTNSSNSSFVDVPFTIEDVKNNTSVLNHSNTTNNCSDSN